MSDAGAFSYGKWKEVWNIFLDLKEFCVSCGFLGALWNFFEKSVWIEVFWIVPIDFACVEFVIVDEYNCVFQYSISSYCTIFLLKKNFNLETKKFV